jgi:hypothetical protein
VDFKEDSEDQIVTSFLGLRHAYGLDSKEPVRVLVEVKEPG